jgi:hypothetical protein
VIGILYMARVRRGLLLVVRGVAVLPWTGLAEARDCATLGWGGPRFGMGRHPVLEPAGREVRAW